MVPDCHILKGGMSGMAPDVHIRLDGKSGMVPDALIILGGKSGMVPDGPILLGGKSGMVPDGHILLGGRVGMVPDIHILLGGRSGMAPDSHILLGGRWGMVPMVILLWSYITRWEVKKWSRMAKFGFRIININFFNKKTLFYINSRKLGPHFYYYISPIDPLKGPAGLLIGLTSTRRRRMAM